MVPAGNKAKRLSSVNHTTKTIHQFIIHLRRTFLFLGRTRKFWTHLLAPKIFIPLIYIRNKKITIWHLTLTCVPHPGIKPETQKVRFQLALNYSFCRKTPPPTHWQLQHSKLQKIKLDLLSLPPLVFHRRFTLIRIERQVYISPSGKQSCTTEVGQWLASRQATSTCSLLLT